MNLKSEIDNKNIQLESKDKELNLASRKIAKMKVSLKDSEKKRAKLTKNMFKRNSKSIRESRMRSKLRESR